MVVATRQKPKHTALHKKRVGEHQRRSLHFMKAYWPYIPMVAIVGLALLVNAVMIQPRVLGYATNMSVNDLLVTTNKQRDANGLADLTLNAQLTRAAQTKAEDMATRDYWSHTTPDGQEPWVFITNAGYQYAAAGENLAYGFATSTDTISGWMNSPGHRANVLSGEYSEVGFGITNSANFQSNGEETIVVAMYGKPLSALITDPANNSLPQPVVEQSVAATEQAAHASNDAQRATTASTTATKNISHLQIMTNGAAPWSLGVATVVSLGLLGVLIGRHSVAWHRVLRKGEQFALKHKSFDIILLTAIVVVALVSQTSGYIQ